MCILFIAIKQHPDYPMIICANRDEFHQRPTQNMHWWTEQEMLAGKDLQAGGTWLGLNATDRFSALTNFRRPEHFDVSKRSRGDLAMQALVVNQTKMQQYLAQKSHQYNDFNLVFGPLNNLQTFDSVNQTFTTLKPGFHSVCNGALDDIWPKMTLGVNILENLVTAEKVTTDALFSVMRNQNIVAKQHLPSTGLSTEWESLLSSIFIISPEYGTRTTAIILQSTSGDVEVYERNYNAEGITINNNNFHIKASTKTIDKAMP